MKLLFLNLTDSTREGGGGEVVLWDQIRGFAGRGHRCTLLVAGPGRSLTSQISNGITVWRAGLKNIYWPSPRQDRNSASKLLWHALDSYNPLMARYLAETIRRELPDVVSIHNQAGWSSAIYRVLRNMSVPAVQILHGHYLMCPRTIMYQNNRNCERQCSRCRVLRLPHRRMSNHISAVVGVSAYILRRHLDAGFFQNVHRRYVIHNARHHIAGDIVDVSLLPQRNGVLRIGYMGRLDPAKGIEQIVGTIEAFDRLDVELWVAGGDNAYARKLKSMSKTNNVHFMGYVSPHEFYPKVDCVVVPSLMHDTLPGVVYEAFCFGKAVIGAKRGGIPEMVAHGNNGYLFEPNNPEELYSIVDSLIRDRNQLRRVCAGAAQSAPRYMDMSRWLDDYAHVYEEVSRSQNAVIGHGRC